jgi:hypothetical protein
MHGLLMTAFEESLGGEVGIYYLSVYFLNEPHLTSTFFLTFHTPCLYIRIELW